jgi:phosphoglycerate dehydrogenase-like enzyme
MYRVLVTDARTPSFDVEEEILRQVDATVWLAPASDEETLAREASRADAVMVRLALVGEPVIAAAAKAGCRAIVRYGIGFDNVDVAAADRHGIPVANVPDFCLDEVADHTMALLLASARGLPQGTSSMRQGGWELPRGQIRRIAGRVLGLVGFGRSGRRVPTRAQAFGLRVTADDPVATIDAPGVEVATSLEDVLAGSDFISMHVPLSPETRHLIDATAIGKMQRTPLLINTARGGLIDTDAALEALQSGQIGGLALDVFETEPLPPDHPLRSHPRALLTPHMSFYSNESEVEVKRKVAQEVARGLRGEPLLNALTKVRVAVPRTSR